jgi:hypothetical protein
LEDITAEHLIKALKSEEIRSSPKDFLKLAKMLCAKKGMQRQLCKVDTGIKKKVHE